MRSKGESRLLRARPRVRVIRLGSELLGLLAACLFTHACIVPKTTCEYTKTCGTETKETSIETTTTVDVDASVDANVDATTITADANASISSGNDSEPKDASVDGSVEQKPEASVSEPIGCQRSADCTADQDRWVCHETEHVCTQCDNKFDCNGTPQTAYCKILPDHPQDNECVQCLSDNDCTDAVCVANECVRCNPRTNAGCMVNAPNCALIDEQPTCVTCAVDEHCSAELPLCVNNQCVLCTSEDARHCPLETPACATDEARGRCVRCLHNDDCKGLEVGGEQVDGLCIDEQCTVCELGSDQNCDSELPICAALMPEGDSGVSLYVPEGVTADGMVTYEQYLAYEHRCVECVDETEAELEELAENDDKLEPIEAGYCAGMAPACFEGECVECTATKYCKRDPAASVCDLTTHLCVGCSQLGDCAHLEATPACDVANRVCVECTAERGDCGNKACHTVPTAGQYSCSDAQLRSAEICGECLSDMHCPTNSACVTETYEGVQSYRCLPIQGLWDQGKECGDIVPPFVTSYAATSVDGLSATFCRPRSTSCQGYFDYGRGTVLGDGGLATCNSNDDCGLPGVADGVCVAWTESTNRCTYQCVSGDDCRAGCSSMTAVDEAVQQVCSLAL